MQSVVLKFGVFRERLTDGVPELTGKAMEQLVLMLQAEQVNPVPYRPQMVGLVERFNRTWKDFVATYMHKDGQNDWDAWIDFAVYAYNSGKHSTVALSPNELMLGRRLRPPNELLRKAQVKEAGELTIYHQRLLAAMKNSHECAERAREREQEGQARYYNRKVRRQRVFRIGDKVWLFRPPRGPTATKFVHLWAGPMRIIDVAGYDNFLIEREDRAGGREFIAHVSFLVAYHQPEAILTQAAADIDAQLEYESQPEGEVDDGALRESTEATAAAVHAVTTKRTGKRPYQAGDAADAWERPSEKLVESRRRRRRNKAGHYVLEYELQPVRPTPGAPNGDKRWGSITEYDELFEHDRVVEDSGFEKGV
ncbi:unnamed protein product [Phytophthora fragariaefolia]|uniref:Unnamed protein product n=1 Tax=Phytophthora fragariaefolia TaxID=1490495 RepID=A0A9W6YCI2_9STRA|nr:unnamed protein product [Phytophthora fragariaefolia]